MESKEFIKRYSNQRWELLLDKEQYLFSNEENTDYKTEIASFKRSFPYPYGPSSYAYFTTMLSMSPASDEITADFAKTLIMSEELGMKEQTDFLAVSSPLMTTSYTRMVHLALKRKMACCGWMPFSQTCLHTSMNR